MEELKSLIDQAKTAGDTAEGAALWDQVAEAAEQMGESEIAEQARAKAQAIRDGLNSSESSDSSEGSASEDSQPASDEQ